MKRYRIFILFLMVNLYMIQVEARSAGKLLPAKSDKIYFSAFPNFGGSEDVVTAKSIKKFEKLATRKIAWAEFSQHWFNGLVYPKAKIQTISDEGVMPYIRFLPRSGLEQFKAEKKFTLEKIIKGDFDKELRAWAKSAKNHNIPIIIDFALEMNGDWFGWSGHFNGTNSKNKYGKSNYFDGPEKYRDAYRHIIDLFRAQKVSNVTWFFHPNIQSSPNEEWNLPKYYYPGDEYIDWIGISIYGAFYPKKSYWDTFDDILKENYQNILEISSTKPLAILEMGVTDHHISGKKSKWIEDAFKTILSQKYLNFKAINYWHESWDDDGSLASLKIDSSVESLTTFQKVIQNDRFTSIVNLSVK